MLQKAKKKKKKRSFGINLVMQHTVNSTSVTGKTGRADPHHLLGYAVFVLGESAFYLILRHETGSYDKYEAFSHKCLDLKEFRTWFS